MIRVLFVCMGNICRSPMADAVMLKLVKEAGLSDKIMVDSAGTGGWHAGNPAHEGTLAILKKHDIPYDGRARQVTRDDLRQFDYVVAMDEDNLSNLFRLDASPTAEVDLLLNYTDTMVKEVPDPYYTGGFDYVYTLVLSGCKALLARIRKEHGI